MSNIKRGITMLLAIKESALSAKLGDEHERVLRCITGCGMFAIASHIDDIVKTIIDQQTKVSNYKYQYELSHEVENQWCDLGFCEAPDDMSEEQKAELRAIAKKFYPEDDELEEIEKKYPNPSFDTNRVKTDIECPKCGKKIFKRTDIVLGAYPSKYQYECDECGWVGYGHV